jgi:hypothetical protein
MWMFSFTLELLLERVECFALMAVIKSMENLIFSSTKLGEKN